MINASLISHRNSTSNNTRLNIGAHARMLASQLVSKYSCMNALVSVTYLHICVITCALENVVSMYSNHINK